jgi:hypothetical protein
MLVLVAGATSLLARTAPSAAKGPAGLSRPATTLAGGATSPESLPQQLYGDFSPHLPTSPSFFPIAVWTQSPSGGDVPAPFRNQAQAFKAMGVNTFVAISDWPYRFGDDGGELAAACANKEYIIAGGDVNSDTSAQSVASVHAVLAKDPKCAKYLVGYQMGIDEPSCSTDVAALVATIHNEDPTRMVYINQAGWYPNQKNPGCRANLRAPSIASADDYAITNPWNPPGPNRGCLKAPTDCLWQYGPEVDNMRADVGPHKPVWVFVETGTDTLGFPTQNGSACNVKTNLCSDGNEYRATPPQVNSAAWLTLIHGSNGLEWFCNDTASPDYCAGGGSDGHLAGNNTTIPANLSYIDHAVESFARELNAPNAKRATIRSSNRRVPIDQMVKVVNGVTYLFVESDRDGSTTGRFRLGRSLGGATATVVYDSDGHYDRGYSETGKRFTLSSTGSFTDELGAHGDNYEVKIYKISG